MQMKIRFKLFRSHSLHIIRVNECGTIQIEVKSVNAPISLVGHLKPLQERILYILTSIVTINS